MRCAVDQACRWGTIIHLEGKGSQEVEMRIFKKNFFAMVESCQAGLSLPRLVLEHVHVCVLMHACVQACACKSE